MKKLLIVIITVLLLASCQKNREEPAAVVDISQPEIIMPEVQVTPVPDESRTKEAAGTPKPEYGTNAGITVIRTVSFIYGENEDLMLYGAAEYTNSGDCPVTVTSAVFTFSLGGAEVTNEFVPVLSEYDVVLPGQNSYVTLWLPYEGETAANEVTLSVSLKCERTDKTRIELVLDDLYLADNYPGFTTLSGSVRNISDTECSLNLAYAGFYDETGSLIGVWYFTKNATLSGGDEKNFVVHMTGLPSGLSLKTAEIRSAAFGFN